MAVEPTLPIVLKEPVLYLSQTHTSHSLSPASQVVMLTPTFHVPDAHCAMPGGLHSHAIPAAVTPYVWSYDISVEPGPEPALLLAVLALLVAAALAPEQATEKVAPLSVWLKVVATR